MSPARWATSTRSGSPGAASSASNAAQRVPAALGPPSDSPASKSSTARARPEELEAVYPHRWAVPRKVWTRFFESAEREIGILAYSSLFLAEDTDILRILADKARIGVAVRIALGDPDSPQVALRGQEGIGDAIPAKIRNALALYTPLHQVENVEIRLHRTVLNNSIYRADAQLIVNQHVYGVAATHSPVFFLRESEHGDMTGSYVASFEGLWSATVPFRATEL